MTVVAGGDGDPSNLRANPTERVKALASEASNVPVSADVPMKRYYRSAMECYRMANMYEHDRSHEQAFKLYTRFASLFVEKFPKHPEYEKYAMSLGRSEQIMRNKKIQNSMQQAEKLKMTLRKQFEEDAEKYREEQERERIEQQRHAAEKEAADLAAAMTAATVSRPLPSAPPMRPPLPTAGARVADASSSQSYPNVTPLDRPATAPAPALSTSLLGATGLRTVQVPQDVVDQFRSVSDDNTTLNVETCGVLAGKLEQNHFAVTHIIVPRQHGTSDSCSAEDEDQIFRYQDEHDLITLGWIHTHPSQTAFLSSVDMHSHVAYQMMLPEAIAVVLAPKFNECGVFSLTATGLSVIGSCSLKGFHPHDNPASQPLFEESPHATMATGISCNLVDLRHSL